MAAGPPKEGYLRKEGGKRKNWRRRWFVLQPTSGTLFYHTKKGGKLKGKISLRYCGDISAVNYKKKNYCFAMDTPERIWRIHGYKQTEMQEWIDALKKVRDYYKGDDGDLNELNNNNSSNNNNNTNSKTTITNGGEKQALNGNSNGGSKVDENSFIKVKVIGRGSFGKVFKVKKKETNEIFAMKVLNKADVAERNEVMHARAENSILRKLDCPFLVHMHYAFQNELQLFFIMDYVNGGELFFHLQKEGKFANERVKFYVAEIVLGLEYLHSRGIIYRDLKPENLLLSADGHIIMTDFGISKEGLSSNNDGTSTFCGTPEYLAPEVLKQQKYTKAVDWWSLGTLMYEMLTGLPPFYTEEVQNMYYDIINTELQMPPNSSPEAQSLLSGFLDKDPSTRLSDPIKIKAHPFFSGIDWDKLYKKETKAPFIPPVTSKDDDSQISPEFTDTPVHEEEDSPKKPGKKAPLHFEGFTFVGGKQ